MTEPADGVTTAIQREMLRVVLRNSARSVPLLMGAVAYIGWLGWHGGQYWAAAACVMLGITVSVWRLALNRRHGDDDSINPQLINGLVRQLEGNAFAAGVMWALATLLIYPTLSGTTATVYVVIACGSLATAAFFLSLAGHSFVLLNVSQGK